MSEHKKDLNETELQKVSGGDITILDFGNGKKLYVVSEESYDPNMGFTRAARFEDFTNLEKAKNYAEKNGWSTKINKWSIQGRCKYDGLPVAKWKKEE